MEDPDLCGAYVKNIKCLCEKQNLTMRMSIRFLTRFANAFSKKADNLKTEVALHYVHYDVVEIHMEICLSLKIKLRTY